MKTLLFMLLLNQADGSQSIAYQVTMPERDCLALQAAIWAAPSPVAYVDDLGAAPAIDAACMPLASLETAILFESGE